jgi:hypothetical protein
MTRKHYVAIAAAFAPAWAQARRDSDGATLAALATVLDKLCQTFLADNPNFDQARFRRAITGG